MSAAIYLAGLLGLLVGFLILKKFQERLLLKLLAKPLAYMSVSFLSLYIYSDAMPTNIRMVCCRFCHQ